MQMNLLKPEFTGNHRDIFPSVPLHEQIDSVPEGLCVKKQRRNVLKQNPYQKREKGVQLREIYFLPKNTHHPRSPNEHKDSKNGSLSLETAIRGSTTTRRVPGLGKSGITRMAFEILAMRGSC